MHDQTLYTALAHHRAGRLAEAADAYRKILEANPRNAEALHLLGLTMAQNGQPAEGAKLIQRAIDLQPKSAVFHTNMGYALRLLGRPEIAVKAYRQSVALEPGDDKVWLDLGQTLAQIGEKENAMDAFRRVIALKPDSARAHNDLGSVLLKSRRVDEAARCFQQAIELEPQFAEAHHNLALALSDSGLIERAVNMELKSIALAPDQPAPYSGLIYMLQFHPGYDRAAIYREMQKYDDRFGVPLEREIRPLANNRNPDRRLKIGYVSPDFYLHAECYFVLPLLRSHDHQQFEVHCYSSVQQPDDVTEAFKACADVWHDVSRETDEQLAERIRADQIDILVDLTMHMRNYRLQLFARKPAPVQVTWLAYPGGTGLKAIDYRLSDAHMDPPEFDAYYSEKTVRLPGCWCCFDPLAKVEGEISSPRGFTRFGSLNNPDKLNDTTLRLWRRVLEAVPNSRMLMLAISEDHRNRVRQLFSELQIDPQRLEFTARMDRISYFRRYTEIDVCLDPVPYNGITTTLDALWMGTPVVTLIGQTAPGRAGLSILSTLGMPELIARSEEEFISIASGGNFAPREEIRRRFRESPLMDDKRFARNVENAYREMWRNFVR